MGRGFLPLIVVGLAAGVLGIALVGVAVLPPRKAPKPQEPAAEPARHAVEDAPPEPGDLEIDPKLIQYRQTAEIATGLHEVHALAVGPDDQVSVGGDRVIRRYGADGKQQSEIALDAAARCLAIGGRDHVSPGRIYVGMDEHVEVFDSKGVRMAPWKTLGDKAAVTSIAVAERKLFVADAGNRVVWCYNASGEVENRIGDASPSRQVPGFQITSRYFDLALGNDDLVYVVNPRALRLEGYTFQGDLEVHWGKGSPAVDGFFGCCNPVHVAVLPNGSFVTAEKGIPRIKVYSPDGTFDCVVAGPRQMPVVAADLATDHRGRILVLDPSTSNVRIFERSEHHGR